jgi:biopolymer transport protein ExbD
MALAKRNEGANVSSDINVTPMVDVMLVLLIIFMVVTPMLQHGKQVDMAQVNSPIDMHDADKEDALQVAITRDNKVFFGTDPINPDDLTQKIKDKLANRTDKNRLSQGRRAGEVRLGGGSGGRCSRRRCRPVGTFDRAKKIRIVCAAASRRRANGRAIAG